MSGLKPATKRVEITIDKLIRSKGFDDFIDLLLGEEDALAEDITFQFIGHGARQDILVFDLHYTPITYNFSFGEAEW